MDTQQELTLKQHIKFSYSDCVDNYHYDIKCLITCVTITFAIFILHLHED